MKARTTGFIMLGLTIAYSIVETRYFGWNNLPQSEAEMVCDGIGLILLFISMIMFVKR